jgi:hypothetical protein
MDQHEFSEEEDEVPVFEGGDGRTAEEAITINNVSSHLAGVRAEKEYISRQFGEQGRDWDLKKQALTERDDGTQVDEMTIETSSGETKTLYFDVSDFTAWNFRTELNEDL